MNDKAVVYARVSTNAENQLHSLESQKEYYSQYAQNSGYELVKVYYDEGISATSPNRDGFLQMLYDAGLNYTKDKDSGEIIFKVDNDRQPQFNWIIVKDPSRFARNIDAMSIIRKLRDDKNVYIDFENMGFTTYDNDFEFRLSLFLTFAQQESIDRSMKGKKAYDIRSKKGIYHMSNILLGYQRNPDTKEYEVNEDEAPIIREIFDTYVNKKQGTHQISKMLNDKGYKTRNGNMFDRDAVARLLKNEKFKGQIVLKRIGHTGVTGSHKRITMPESEQIKHDDAIPAIISSETFDKAQEIMSQRIKETKGGKKGAKMPVNEFANKIFCDKCGSDYIRITTLKHKKSGTVREFNYCCRNRRYKKSKTDDKCNNRGISHNVLLRELSNIGKELSNGTLKTHIDNEKETLNTLLNDLNYKLENNENEKQNINNKISDLDNQIANVTESIANGVSDAAQKILTDKIDKIESEKDELNAQLLTYDTIIIENEKQKYVDKYNEIIEFYKKREYNVDEVIQLLHKIVITEQEAIIEVEIPTLQNEVYTDGTENAVKPFFIKLP